MVWVRGPEGLRVTGVYGVGKTTLVEEIATSLEQRGVRYAAIDIDWLGWFSAPDAATEKAVQLGNLRDMVQRYLAAGVRFVAMAHSVPDPISLESLRAAVGIPVRVVGLQLPYREISHRLADAPTRGRRDDLREAAEWLAEGKGSGFEDLVLTSDRPVSQLATDVIAWMGWPDAGGQ